MGHFQDSHFYFTTTGATYLLPLCACRRLGSPQQNMGQQVSFNLLPLFCVVELGRKRDENISCMKNPRLSQATALRAEATCTPGALFLCFVELFLWLLAARTTPVVREVFEGYAVVLCGVIYVATDGAHVLAGCLGFGEIHFCEDSRHGVV